MAEKIDILEDKNIFEIEKNVLELEDRFLEVEKAETVIEDTDIFSPIVVVKPDKPIDPIDPIWPVDPIDPDDPLIPIDPDEPEYPVVPEPDEPGEPEEPEPAKNDLIFSGENPVIINRNGDADNIFDSIRTSSCDVNIVSKDLLTDLYTAKKDDVIMEIVVDGNVEWEGYLTPNSFSQPLTQNLDQIAMTAIDPIALLKYVTIDKILERPNVLTYKELIGKALAYVMLDQNYLYVEETVDYGQDKNALLDMMLQVNNFWDEASEPMTCYEMIAEMLKPFGLVLVFSGQAYFIYDMTKSTDGGLRWFSRYRIASNGTLINAEHNLPKNINMLDYGTDYKANNVTSSNISIPSTYDKVTGEASTQIPSYSLMAKDKVNPDMRDQYDAAWFNVSRNRMDGVQLYPQKELTDRDWQFIWNGVWIDSEYNLKTLFPVSGFSNIQDAYKWVSGRDGYKADTGSVLNFYGSASNPIGEGIIQENERPVEVKTCITAYAPDNGTPPEFLTDKDFFKWAYTHYYAYESEGGYWWSSMHLVNRNRSEYGTGKNTPVKVLSYRQNYDNITLIKEADQKVSMRLRQKYSRTGFPDPISISQYAEASNVTYDYWTDWDGEQIEYVSGANIYQQPGLWNSAQAVCNYTWFNRYMANNHQLERVWDRRNVYMYIRLVDGTYMQFNGKDWVNVTTPNIENCFTFKRLLNDKKIFHNEMSYNLIECADGDTYSLTDEAYTYTYRTYTQSKVTYQLFVSEGKKNGINHHTETFPVYKSNDNDFIQWIDRSDEGELSIILPRIDATNVTVTVDIYSSNLLGTTGMSSHGSGYGYAQGWQALDKNRSQVVSGDGGDDGYDFMPVNCSYFKAEHLDLDMELTVPESNLGQMFSTSDIKYYVDLKKNYLLQYEGPTFKVNTFNNLVSASYSYLIYGDSTADPGKFVINGKEARPEAYVVNAYLNYLSKIRRRYEKTIVPLNGRKVSNMLTFINAPEVTNNNLVSEGEYLVVTSDSWDVKTDRHTIQAVECYKMDVDEVRTVPVIEIPRRARNERFNYPSSIKNF